MIRAISSLAFVATLVAGLAAAQVVSPAAMAQDAKAPPKKAASSAAPKVGKDQKVCRHRFPDGKSTTWVCQKDQPCCAWDEIRYVKCGNTITRCL